MSDQFWLTKAQLKRIEPIFPRTRGIPRDFLIQALGVWFLSSFGVLGLALARHDALSDELLLASLLALVPALAGQWIGQRLRRHIPEAAFRRLVLAALGVFGFYIALRAL